LTEIEGLLAMHGIETDQLIADFVQESSTNALWASTTAARVSGEVDADREVG
jgi:hypothetical protein